MYYYNRWSIMNKIITCFLAIIVLMGCSTHVHTVGMGPQIGEVESARQWYALYGTVPLNTVDTGAMANGADDYEIKTAIMPLDILIGIPALSTISVSSRTVIVTR
mgnify:CR=1 FL=1